MKTKALVVWIKPENGGKKKIPEIECMFYPTIKISGDCKTINWSSFLINKQLISENQTVSEIGFLMKDAPHYLLKSGVKFILFEGAKKIGSGEII